MSTEVAVVTENALALPSTPEGQGLEDVKLQVTPIELVQPSSKRDATHGSFYDVLMEEEHESIQVVPLRICHSRVLFPPGRMGESPICTSLLGVVPDRWAMEPQNPTCKGCPQNDWSKWDKRNGAGEKPRCRELWKLYMILRNTGFPRFLNITPSSRPALQKVVQRIKQDAEGAKITEGRVKNLYEYSFEITSKRVMDNKGNYFVLQFGNVKRLANPQEFSPFYQEIVEAAQYGNSVEDTVDSTDVPIEDAAEVVAQI